MVWLVYNHNRLKEGKRLVTHLYKRKWPGTVLVLDDACAPDQKLKLWLKHTPLAYLYLSSDEYLGEAAGYDRMVQTAKIQGFQDIVITNCVVEVSDNFIMEVGSMFQSGKRVVGGGSVLLAKRSYLGGGKAHDWTVQTTGKVEECLVAWLSPACLVLTIEAYEDGGPFTRGYYQGMWSVDWCERVKQAGYGLNILPIWVKFSGSEAKFKDVVGAGSSYFSGRNGWLFWHYRQSFFQTVLRAGIWTLRQWRRVIYEEDYREGVWDGLQLQGGRDDVRISS